MHVIDGNLQDYAWGIVDGLSPWRKAPAVDVVTGKPEAELWYGAHVNGPSQLTVNSTTDSSVTLADEVNDSDVPILVKLLAAAKPLSLQIHPSEALAESLLTRQESHPEGPQLLSDPYAKTEMLIALTDFSALLGLRDSALAAQLVDGLGVEGTTAADQLRANEPAEAIRTLIGASPAAIEQAERELVQRMKDASLDAPAIAAMQTVIDHYPGDSGVLVAALLQHHQLAPGQALFASAGIVHAYISGIGVEVMVASDNVFRLGLTPKTVAVDEALAALDVDLEPVILAPEAHAAELVAGASNSDATAATERLFAPEGSPFTVRSVMGGQAEAITGSYRLVLVTSGTASISAGDETVRANPGEAVVILAAEPTATVAADGQVFIAQSTND